MDSSKNYIYKVEKDIVDKALREYGDGKISRDELKNIADFTVEEMKKVNNRLDLINFLKILAGKWPIFSNIAIIEEGSYKQEVEKGVYSQVLELAKHGKIDEAINLSKSMTK